MSSYGQCWWQQQQHATRVGIVVVAAAAVNKCQHAGVSADSGSRLCAHLPCSAHQAAYHQVHDGATLRQSDTLGMSGDKLDVVVVVIADDFDLLRGFFIAERAGGGGKRVRERESEDSKECCGYECEWGAEEVVEAEEEAKGTVMEWEGSLCVLRWGVGAEVGVGQDDDSRSRRCWGWGG
jgi:hypothetical protein